MIDSEGPENDKQRRRNRKVWDQCVCPQRKDCWWWKVEGKKGRQWQEVSAIYYKLQRMYAGAKNSLDNSTVERVRSERFTILRVFTVAAEEGDCHGLRMALQETPK